MPPPAPNPDGYRAVEVPLGDAALWEGMRPLSVAPPDETLPRAANEPFSHAQVVARRLSCPRRPVRRGILGRLAQGPARVPDVTAGGGSRGRP